jgi:DNA (cytosine-5)-methyltransferase 1
MYEVAGNMDAYIGDRWLSTSDLCQYLSISNDILYRWIQNDGFPAQKIGNRWKARRDQVESWISIRLDNPERLQPATSRQSQREPPWEIFTYPLLSEKKCTYTHVSLFSGCGGIDLGFRRAGFKTVFAIDIDEDACMTYKENIGEIIVGDICKTALPKMKKLDLLTAGFPCQPFSNAGSRKGISDYRGSLFFSALNAVEQLSPRVVMFENVRGLLSSKHEGKYLIETIANGLSQLGYTVTFSLVDASKHNVPQKRLRVFIIGVKKTREMGEYAFPPIVNRDDLTLKHIVMNIPKRISNQDEILQLNPQALAIAKKIPEGGSWKDIPYKELPDRLKKIHDNIERYHWPKFYRRFHRDEIAGTITAAFKPENAGVWHPTEGRVFSVREIARIQTFPDWFVFRGKNIKSKYQQIGNAVPPRLAFELAQQIIKVLNGKDLLAKENSMLFSEFKKLGRPIRVCDKNIIYDLGGK